MWAAQSERWALGERDQQLDHVASTRLDLGVGRGECALVGAAARATEREREPLACHAASYRARPSQTCAELRHAADRAIDRGIAAIDQGAGGIDHQAVFLGARASELIEALEGETNRVDGHVAVRAIRAFGVHGEALARGERRI